MADTEEGHSDETRWVSYGELARIQGVQKRLGFGCSLEQFDSNVFRSEDEGNPNVGSRRVGLDDELRATPLQFGTDRIDIRHGKPEVLKAEYGGGGGEGVPGRTCSMNSLNPPRLMTTSNAFADPDFVHRRRPEDIHIILSCGVRIGAAQMNVVQPELRHAIIPPENRHLVPVPLWSAKPL